MTGWDSFRTNLGVIALLLVFWCLVGLGCVALIAALDQMEREHNAGVSRIEVTRDR